MLWYLQDDENLSAKAHSAIDSGECFYSKVSLWEIAIKQSIGKLHYQKTILEIEQLCHVENFLDTSVTASEIEKVKTLPFIHNDPFDRLLISQSQTENLVIITRDSIIPKYPVETLW